MVTVPSLSTCCALSTGCLLILAAPAPLRPCCAAHAAELLGRGAFSLLPLLPGRGKLPC